MPTSPLRAVVAGDLHVVGRVGADGREGAVGDVVAGDDDAVGAEDVDAVSVLPGAAGLGGDARDTVAGDDGAVFALAPAMDEDAAVAAVLDRVVGDRQPGRLDHLDAGVARTAHRRARNPPGAAVERQPRPAAADDGDVLDGHAARFGEVDDPRHVFVERPPGAVDDEVADLHDFAPLAGDHGAAAAKHQPRRPGDAGEPHARREHEIGDEERACRQEDLAVVGGGGIEQPLQGNALVDRGVRIDAELGGVERSAQFRRAGVVERG